MPLSRALVAVLALAPALALLSPAASVRRSRHVVKDFGDKFYMVPRLPLESWGSRGNVRAVSQGSEYAPPFGAPLAEGVFEVKLKKPLGIVFEEVGTTFSPQGSAASSFS